MAKKSAAGQDPFAFQGNEQPLQPQAGVADVDWHKAPFAFDFAPWSDPSIKACFRAPDGRYSFRPLAGVFISRFSNSQVAAFVLAVDADGQVDAVRAGGGFVGLRREPTS